MQIWLLERFNALNVHKSKGTRYPNKPLLVLWAIGQCLQGRDRLTTFAEVHEGVAPLLKMFGPPAKGKNPTNKANTIDPFWFLQNDKVWEIPHQSLLVPNKYGHVSPKDARKFMITGGFLEEIYEEFRRDRTIAHIVAKNLLHGHFPERLHPAILKAAMGKETAREVMLNNGSELVEFLTKRRKRHAAFRNMVLEEYNYSCAVCGYSIEFPEQQWPGLEAAHIKWHSHCGPDETQNGISLCVLHHELFDWGLFTIEPRSLCIEISNSFLQLGRESAFTQLHHTSLQIIPSGVADKPNRHFLDWHRKNVFR